MLMELTAKNVELKKKIIESAPDNIWAKSSLDPYGVIRLFSYLIIITLYLNTLGT